MRPQRSVFRPTLDPIANKANWIGRYLAVEKKFSDKLSKVLAEAALNIDEFFGDLVKDNVSTKVARVRIGLAHNEIRRQMRDIFGTTKNLISDHQQDAAVAAINAKLYDEKGVLSWLLPDPVDRLQYADSLRQTARRNIEATIARTLFTEKPLSQRVYRTEALANGLVSRTINNALARGDSARNLAKDVRALIDPAVPGGVSYAAMRLGRTEINNAFHAQSILDTQETPWVQSMHWYLSKRHEKDPGDECEIYAAQGSFDKENVPEKPHPNCRCFVTPDLPDYDEFERGLISGQYDPYLDSVMGQGFSASQSEIQQSGAFAERKPVSKPTEEVKWTGPKVGKPLKVEYKGSKSASFVRDEAEHGPAAKRKEAADIADNILVDQNLESAWASTRFDEYKDYFRKGARDAMRVGYEKFPTAYKEEIVNAAMSSDPVGAITDPAIFKAYGKEIVARAVNSDPTTEVLYRGMQIEADDLDKFMPGQPLSLPLSSFDTNQDWAIDFAQGRAWKSREVQKLQDPFPVILQLEDGAKVAKMSGSERVAFGQFDIVAVNPPENTTVIRLSQEVITEKPTVIVIRQKSMLEAELSGGRIAEEGLIPDYIFPDAAKGVAPQGKLARETLARVKKLLPNARIDLPEGINEEVFKEIVDNIEPLAIEYPESAASIRAFGFKDMLAGKDDEGKPVYTAGFVQSVKDDYPDEFKAFGGQAVTMHFDSTLASTKNGLRDSIIRSSKEAKTKHGKRMPLQYAGVAEDPMKTLVRHEFIHVRHFNMGGSAGAKFSEEWKGLSSPSDARTGIIKFFEQAVTDPSKHNGAGLNEWFNSIVSELPRYAGSFQESSPTSFGDMDMIEVWAVAGEQADLRPGEANEIDKILWQIFNEVYDKYIIRKKKPRRRKAK